MRLADNAVTVWVAATDKHITVLIWHAINAVTVYFLVDILVKVL